MEPEGAALAPQSHPREPKGSLGQDPDAAVEAAQPLLEMRGIRKAFPGVQAVDGVSLTLRTGQVLALLGENGAGKSTLIKVLTGLYHAEEGQIFLEGAEVHIGSPEEAIASGIALVPQERNLVPRFSAGENIMLESLPTNRVGIVDYDRVHGEAQKWLDLLNVPVDSRTPVSELSVAQMQLVEIARAISRQGHILVLDEPTASITSHETIALFDILRRLSEQGVGIIFVSHKLEEVFELCDTISVLRDGKNAGPQTAVRDMDREKVITLMVGRAQVTHELPPRTEGRGGSILELRNVSTSSGATGVSLTLNRGEILGLYGLVGAGRSELARSILGADKVLSGEVLVDGKPARIGNVSDALDRYGIGYVSENRKEEGLIQIHSVLSNVSITVWKRLQNALGWIGGRAERAIVEPYVKRLDIKTPSLSTVVANLSGGNQQKVSLAKWLTAGVRVLIIDEPTVGIDVRTKANLHDLIWELASQGLAIILISSDMPEMVRLADRIVVMRAGRIAGELENNHDYDETSKQIMAFIH
jgi:ribose transport system ATP-binding protein